ncbi:unnamed protein product [Cochlearia groenlandica]
MSVGGGPSHDLGQQFVPFATNNESLRVELLHGNLDIWVKEAKHLPNMDGFHKGLGGMLSGLSRRIKVEGQRSLKITSDEVKRNVGEIHARFGGMLSGLRRNNKVEVEKLRRSKKLEGEQSSEISSDEAKHHPNEFEFHRRHSNKMEIDGKLCGLSGSNKLEGEQSSEISSDEAKHHPNEFEFHRRHSNKMEIEKSSKITSDPYVVVSIGGAVIGRTFVITNNENPFWMQHFDVPVAHYATEVYFVVKDNDIIGSKFMGAVGIPTEQLCSGDKIEGYFPILNSSGKPCKQGAMLSLSIQYTPMESLRLYQISVGFGNEFVGVPGTYFPLRKGGRVTMYQDAHVDEGSLPSVNLDGGIQYRHGKCWEDMYDAIKQARKLIYITGWSVYHQVRLVRPNNGPTRGTLGDLLKAKSQEGVRVLLLVWDDPTSRNVWGYKTQGVMNTSDEETHRFFKFSSVKVVLCPRFGGKLHSFIKKMEVATIYTHHQKTVIVDADAPQHRRKIVAFVGGLDLCDGRYDTPKHSLFRTLKTFHKDDFHNPIIMTSADDGPREPWHDMHCKIDGPAAYDVLANFEERWLKASKPRGIKKLRPSHDDSLLKIDRIPDIIGLSESSYTNENDTESWHVQVIP